MQAAALQRRTSRLRLVGLHTTTQSGFPHRPPDSPDSPLLTCSDRRRIISSATVFHLDSSLLAAFLLCDTDMGLSSMGLLLLPLCVFVSVIVSLCLLCCRVVWCSEHIMNFQIFQSLRQAQVIFCIIWTSSVMNIIVTISII